MAKLTPEEIAEARRQLAEKKRAQLAEDLVDEGHDADDADTMAGEADL